MNMRRALERAWYEGGPLALLLTPLAALFCAVVRLRRLAYRQGWLATERLPVPVIVVGNLTVGGSGKTPLVIWLIERLRERGFRPGVVSRGYGGSVSPLPRTVTGDSDPAEVGDEPVLIALRTGAPLVVGAERPAAARLLLQQAGCDVVIADDGMQHYRLGRDIEIAVVDGARRFGNGRCLPAGPLREPVGRLDEIGLVVANGAARGGEFPMSLVADQVHSLGGGTRPLAEFRGVRVHAVAGIGHPQRFFDLLREQGIEPIEHPFPDHHRFAAGDLAFGDDLPLLMTEKDAVKCRAFARPGVWFVPVSAQLPAEFGTRVSALLDEVRNG